jgi:hypothetical protein
MQRTLSQNNRLWQLISDLSLEKEQVMDLVRQYTAGRTASSREMEVEEMNRLLSALASQVPGKPKADPDTSVAQDTDDRMRKKCFWLSCEILSLPRADSAVDKKINQQLVYKFVEKHGHAKPAKLNAYTGKGLIKLVSQLDSWKNNNERAAASRIVTELKAELQIP